MTNQIFTIDTLQCLNFTYSLSKPIQYFSRVFPWCLNTKKRGKTLLVAREKKTVRALFPTGKCEFLRLKTRHAAVQPVLHPQQVTMHTQWLKINQASTCASALAQQLSQLMVHSDLSTLEKSFFRFRHKERQILKIHPPFFLCV